MRKNLDKLIWLMTVLITGFGLLALYSASFYNVRVSNEVFYSQLIFAVVGLIMMFFLSRLDYRRFYDISYVFYAVTLFLLVYVLLGGRHALGAQRWLVFAGISFQPSEVAKLALILALARYFSDSESQLVYYSRHRWTDLGRQLIVPLLIAVVPMLLIFKQPDLGTSILFFGIFLIMLFLSGIRLRYFFGLLTLCVIATPFAWHILKPYQKDRLLVFLNPNIDPLGAGYTIIQSKIAIGSGQLFGKGWLGGTQNQLNFLPERHTDFIFSVIGEEWGLAGTLLLLSFYLVLIYAGLKIAEQVKDKFGTQMAIGIVGILTLQVTINMGMVMGLCPVVGLTLPLISYGRTSFIIFIVMMGILLNISKRRTIF